MMNNLDKSAKQHMHKKIMDAFNFQTKKGVCGNTSSHEGDLAAAKALAGMARNVIALEQAPLEDITQISDTLSKAWTYYVTTSVDGCSSSANDAFYAEASTYLCDAIIAIDRYAIKKGFTAPIQ